MLIAIDGPAASGKGTIARRVASHFGLSYLDTGKLYRAVGLKLMGKYPNLRTSDDVTSDIKIASTEEAEQLNLDQLDNEELETEDVGRYASIVSAIPEVRKALFNLQKEFSAREKGAVLDGRDIGTVICPDADFKFFITANPEIRAERRFLQLQSKKKHVTKASVLEDILSRDRRDSGRKIAPLEPAKDALSIDTSNMSIEDVFQKVKNVIDSSI